MDLNEVEDEFFIEDDLEILDILDFGFPRRQYEREDYFDSLDNLSFFKRFRITKQTAEATLDLIIDQLEFENDKLVFQDFFISKQIYIICDSM